MSSTETALDPVRSSTGPNGERRPSRRLVVSGATGRLGRAFAALAVARGWTIAGALASGASASLGRPLADLGVSGASVRVDPPDRLAGLLSAADVYVSAAPAMAERHQLLQVAAAGIPAVVASTGFDTAEGPTLDDVAARIPLVIDSNFSIGMGWVHRAVATLGELPEGYDVTVLEAHRRGKRDRPSGTALALAANVHTARSTLPTTPPDVGTRPVEISSLRVGEMPGIHEIWIGGAHEFLRVEHVVLDRTAFAEGMLLAAQWMVDRETPLKAGRYALADVLGRGGNGR